MPAANWKNPVDGNWTTASDWDTGVVPGGRIQANLDGSTSYVVSITSAITIGSVFLNDAQATLAIDASGQTVKAKGDLEITGTLTIDAADGSGGTTLINKATMGIDGTLQIGNQHLAAPTLVNVGILLAPGTVELMGGTAFNGPLAKLNVYNDSAPITLSGHISLSGNALLEFVDGQVHTIGTGAFLSLDGTQSRIAIQGAAGGNSALTNLTDVLGTLDLANGASIVMNTVSNFSNDGVLNVDSSATQGGSHQVVGETLINTGSLSLGNTALGSSDSIQAIGLDNTHTGTIELHGASALSEAILRIAGPAANRGTIDIGAYAQLAKVTSFTQFSGETIANGTLSTKTIDLTGGTLDGTGDVTGKTTIDGGVIAGGSVAGNAVGTLTLHSSLTINGGGTLESVLTAAGGGSASDVAVTAGKAILNGGTLLLDITDPVSLTIGETFTVLTFTPGKLVGQFSAIKDGAITGSGSSIDLGNGLSLNASYNNSGGNVELTVVASPHAHLLDTLDFGHGPHVDAVSALPGQITEDSAAENGSPKLPVFFGVGSDGAVQHFVGDDVLARSQDRDAQHHQASSDLF